MTFMNNGGSLIVYLYGIQNESNGDGGLWQKSSFAFSNEWTFSIELMHSQIAKMLIWQNFSL